MLVIPIRNLALHIAQQFQAQWRVNMATKDLWVKRGIEEGIAHKYLIHLLLCRQPILLLSTLYLLRQHPILPTPSYFSPGQTTVSSIHISTDPPPKSINTHDSKTHLKKTNPKGKKPSLSPPPPTLSSHTHPRAAKIIKCVGRFSYMELIQMTWWPIQRLPWVTTGLWAMLALPTLSPPLRCQMWTLPSCKLKIAVLCELTVQRLHGAPISIHPRDRFWTGIEVCWSLGRRFAWRWHCLLLPTPSAEPRWGMVEWLPKQLHKTSTMHPLPFLAPSFPMLHHVWELTLGVAVHMALPDIKELW